MESLSQKRQVLETLVFIHQSLVSKPYYPEEFQNAANALSMVQEMAEKLNAELTSQSEVEEPKNEQV